MPLESDKSNGFQLNLKDELRSGVYLDLFSHAVPLWADGENIQFTSLGVQKRKGSDQIVDLGAEPVRGVLQQNESSEKVVYAGDLSNIYRVESDAGTSTTVGSGYGLAEDTGGSVWDSGSSTWDAGSTSWDGGLVLADHWSMINYGSFIFATSGADKPQVRKVSSFVDMTEGVTGAIATTAGTGYVVDDVLTLTGGDGTGATAKVISVDGSGGITSVSITDSGAGYTTVPTGFSGGTGTGAALSFTVCDMDVTSVQIFQKRGPHILGFNTSFSGREVIWCDADDPDTWQTASDNLAGALELRELKSDIRAAVPLGSRIAVYGDDQMFLLSYLGNQLVFGYQPALDGVGAVSKKSVVPVGNKNYGLSSQGFFVTDGAGFQYIGDPAVRDWFKNNAAQGQLSKAVAFHDEENNQIRWYFPTTSTSITEGLSFNYQLGTWAPITGNRSAGESKIVLSGPVSGSEDGILYIENTGENEYQTAMTAWVLSKPLDLGDADRVKELDSIRIGYEGVGLTYRIGWSETETGAVTWESYTEMETGFNFHNLRTAGRWLHMELRSEDLNDSWEVMSIELIGRAEGTR